MNHYFHLPFKRTRTISVSTSLTKLLARHYGNGPVDPSEFAEDVAEWERLRSVTATSDVKADRIRDFAKSVHWIWGQTALR